MNYILVILATVATCILLYSLPVSGLFKKLLLSYVSNFRKFKIDQNPEIILKSSIEQFKTIFKLFSRIIIIVSPFILVFSYLFIAEETTELFDIITNLIVLVIFILYFLLKHFIKKKIIFKND